MSKATVALSVLAALAVTVLPNDLGGRDGRDPRGGQGAVYRGGWDGNGPDLIGLADDARTLYRGGWDRNGPDAVGGAAPDLSRLTLEAIELPDGQVIDAEAN